MMTMHARPVVAIQEERDISKAFVSQGETVTAGGVKKRLHDPTRTR